MSANRSAMPVLYSFRRCPYAMRARLAIKTASLACELREVVLRDKPPQMLAISAKATVPILQLASGEVIDESLDVMHWALRQSDPQQWLSADQALTNRLIQQCDSSFKQNLDHYKYHVRHPQHPREYYRARGEVFLAELEQQLSQHQGIALVEQRTTLADIAIFPFVRQFARVDLEWFNATPYPHLQSWLQDLEQSDLYLSVMNKYTPWAEGDPLTIFAG